MTDTAPRFTVLMSVGRFPELLPHAVACVLAQTETDLELILLSDPADAGAATRGQDLSADPRVTVLAGDRAEAIPILRGTFVVFTTDETLWFPAHLAEVATLLATAEYGRLLRTELDPDGAAAVIGVVPDGDTAYRVEAYRRLDGTPGPDPATRFALESITLLSAYRSGPARAQEAEAAYRLVSDGHGRRELRSRALAFWHADHVSTQAAVDAAAAQLRELYRSRGEISAQLLEYAQSRAEYAESRADLHAQVGELTAQNRHLTERLCAIETSRCWRVVRAASRVRAAVRRRMRRR